MTEQELSDKSDSELFELILEKNEDAFNVVYKRYNKIFRNFLYSGLKVKPNDIDSILNSVFNKLYTKAHQIKNSDNIKSWGFSSCKNAYIDLVRSRKRKNEHIPLNNQNGELDSYIENNIVFHHTGFDEVSDKEIKMLTIKTVRKAMSKLDEKHQKVLKLHYINDLTSYEISKKLNIPVPTVLTRLYYARKKLLDRPEFDKIFS